MGGSYHHTEASQGSPLLQVGLSIQTGRLHVAHTLGVGGVEEQEVRRDNPVAGHLDKISHSHVLPAPPHKQLGPPDIRHTRRYGIYLCFVRVRTAGGGFCGFLSPRFVKCNIGSVLSVFI